MKVPNLRSARLWTGLSLSRLQNEGSQLKDEDSARHPKSIKATE